MEANEEGFYPLKEPIQFGYLAAADGLGCYPAFRYRGTDRIIVKDKEDDDKAAGDGFHQVDFGSMDAPRDVDYGYDLSRLNPMQLYLYGKEIGCDINPDFSIADCVKAIQDFMLGKPAYQSRVTLVAQAIAFDYDGAQAEILEAVKSEGGYLL